MPEETRIPLRPQRWLFGLNLLVQPPLAALFLGMFFDPTSGAAAKVFTGLMVLATLGLFGFSVLVLWRIWGKVFEIVVGVSTMEIPNPVGGSVERIAFSDVDRAFITETRASAASFYALTLEHKKDGQSRRTVVSSQLVGMEAFRALRDCLAERGVLRLLT